MNQPLYDIVFTGQMIEGTDIATAQASFTKLFKSSPEQLSKIFNGKPQVLKRGVDKATALKYKTALHQAGLLIAFKPHQTDSEASSANNHDNPNQPPQPPAQQPPADDWSLAPAGSDVLSPDERNNIPNRDVDTSNIKLASTFMDLTPPTQEAPPPPSTHHLSLAQVGEDLLVDKTEPSQPLAINVDDITLAPPGTEMEKIKDSQTPIKPDISHISIAEAGAQLLEGQTQKTPPPPPPTEHLSVDKK